MTASSAPDQSEVPPGDSDERFRSEVRAWLGQRLARHDDGDGRRLTFMGSGEGAEALPAARRFLATLAERGWSTPAWPREYGGAGLPVARTSVLAEELRAFEMPDLYMFQVGLRHAGAAILRFGTHAQKDQWLPRIATGEQIWCQVFSEPGAGSDLAALATRAERDGEVWRITGQKVWVSRAHEAAWGLLLARTDPSVPKHRGITAFALDMSAAGVEVRPLRQVNGDEHFNEVFLDDVEVPDAHRIGEVGGGWGVAVAMLAGERSEAGGVGDMFGGGEPTVVRLIELAQRCGMAGDASVRQELAQVMIETRLAARTTARAAAVAASGREVGPEGSGDKLRKAATLKKMAQLALAIQGDAGAVDNDWEQLFLTAPSISIRGGTDQILLNVIAERILGLPPEPRVDKDVPFSQVPR